MDSCDIINIRVHDRMRWFRPNKFSW